MITPVNFGLAKLLKKKRFNLKVKQRWGIVENIDGDKSPFCQHDCGLFNWNNGKYADYISAPTIAEVVMWLYEKHGIWIIAPTHDNNDNYFCYEINFKPSHFLLKVVKNKWSPKEIRFNSPAEAYEAGIEYTLKKLI